MPTFKASYQKCPNRSIIYVLFLMIFGLNNLSSQENLAQKLGYDKNAKLLIIHADDLGFAHSVNVASLKAIEEGSVNSASIIMSGAWVNEISDYALKNNSNHDLGVHLTITSEWKNFKWGPVASKNQVLSLINNQGDFYADCPKDANAIEVEKELRSQIELAYTMGINPTHLDSHMGCLFWGKLEFFEVYLKLAKEYELPCLIHKSLANLFPDEASFYKMLEEQDALVLIDNVFMIDIEENANGSEAYYTKTLKNLNPGLTQILIHTAYDNEEMQAIAVDHPDYGSAWRQSDFDFFTSDDCKKLIEEENIVMVTWREIAQVLKN